MLNTELTGNQLKFIAAVCMTADHIGAAFFPQIIIFRIIGRLAFPIFSFFIYEGCRYTHNYIRYFSRIFGLGILCAIGYLIYSGEFYGNVLLTFSCSVAVLYVVRFFENTWLTHSKEKRLIGILSLAGCLAVTHVLCVFIPVDYGFAGVILPVFAEFARWISKNGKQNRYVILAGFGAGLLLLSVMNSNIQIFGLLSIPLLALYKGSKGKAKAKYGFYVFYPVYLMLIGMVEMMI